MLWFLSVLYFEIVFYLSDELFCFPLIRLFWLEFIGVGLESAFFCRPLALGSDFPVDFSCFLCHDLSSTGIVKWVEVKFQPLNHKLQQCYPVLKIDIPG